MKQTVIKLAVFLISVGVFVFCIRNEGIAVTEDSTNSVNLQGTVNESLQLNEAIVGGKDLIGAATDLLLATYNASVAGDFTGGADFNFAGNRISNSFDSAKANACLFIAGVGVEFEQTGQASKDNRINYFGSATAGAPVMRASTVTNFDWANGALGGTSSAVTTYNNCITGTVITVVGIGFTNSGAGGVNTAEVFLRNVRPVLSYQVPDLKTSGTRVHTLQIQIETVAGI